MNHYLHYQIGGIGFATRIEEVREIVRTREIFVDSKLPKNIAGFFNLREKRICLFDLPVFLGLGNVEHFEIVISPMEKGVIGFKVEKVWGVIPVHEVIPYPELVPTKDYLNGVVIKGEELLQVLSFQKIISKLRLKALDKYL